MRKTLLMLLLASAVAAPVAAQSRDDIRRERREAREASAEVRESRREVERSRDEVRRDMRRGDVGEARRDMRDLRRDQAELAQDRREARKEWRDMRREERRDERNWDGRRENHRDGADRRDGRDGRDWNDGRNWREHDRGWTGDWRSDRRYDWNRWREAHRDRYRATRYYAPHRHHYRRWSIGYRIDPWFYGQRYWISDPWYYRLPPAYGPYRWVRYYDDVMLVDMRSGLIVDVIYNFFW